MIAGHSIRSFSAWERFVTVLFVSGTGRPLLTLGQWEKEVVVTAAHVVKS